MLRVLLVIGLVASRALAQPATDNKVDAKALMQSGVKLFEAKDYLGALAVFKTAYERFPGPKILLNIGTTLKLLDRPADAANAYQRYLDAKDTDAKRRPEIEKLVAKLDASVGRYAITATPSDAIVTIDDEDWLHVVHGGTWRVTPGKHVISVKADGFTPKTRTVEVAANDIVTLEIQLTAIPKPAPAIITGPAPAVIAAPEPPRSRLGALVFGHFDIPNGGAALVGITADVIERVEVRAAAILGPHVGGYAGASFAFLTGEYRPFITAGVPIFASNGARYGIRGAAGLEYLLNRHLALVIEAGVEHEFNPEMGATKSTVFVPAAGVLGRL
jgi:hypothetical protein